MPSPEYQHRVGERLLTGEGREEKGKGREEKREERKERGFVEGGGGRELRR